MPTVNMPDFCLLGPRIETQTASTFIAHIKSLALRRQKVEKVLKPKRIKKVPVLHDVDEATKLCRSCGRRVKSIKAKCVKKSVDSQSTSMIEPV